MISLSSSALITGDELEKLRKSHKRKTLLGLKLVNRDEFLFDPDSEIQAPLWESAIAEAIKTSQSKRITMDIADLSFDSSTESSSPIRTTPSNSGKGSPSSSPSTSRSDSLSSEDIPEVGKITDEKEIRKIAIKRFNSKPKEGIFLMIQYQLIKNETKEIAKFLKNEPELRKSKIGDFLGEGDSFHKEVMIDFVNLFDFKDLTFDNALRSFLTTFRLPGEAQKIDRIMEAFAGQFCTTNPGIFEHPDTAYVLAFSLIMLNTDAHNPSVLKKMSKEQFLKNNRGINGGKDLDSTLLETLYDSIINNEIEMEHEREDISKHDQQGWLQMQTVTGFNLNKKWTRKFCITSFGCLFIFNDPKETSPLYLIPLPNLAIEATSSKTQKDSFMISNPNGKMKLAKLQKDQIQKTVDGIHLIADNFRKRYEWMFSLNLNTNIAPK